MSKRRHETGRHPTGSFHLSVWSEVPRAELQGQMTTGDGHWKTGLQLVQETSVPSTVDRGETRPPGPAGDTQPQHWPKKHARTHAPAARDWTCHVPRGG